MKKTAGRIHILAVLLAAFLCGCSLNGTGDAPDASGSAASVGEINLDESISDESNEVENAADEGNIEEDTGSQNDKEEEISESAGMEEDTSEEAGAAEESSGEEAEEEDTSEEAGAAEESSEDEPEEEDGEEEDQKTPLIDHVTGIKDFNVIEGMRPDVMAGISWDETIGTVLSDYTEVDWDKPGEQTLTYVIAAMDQTIERESITVTIYPDLDHYIYGMEGMAQVLVGQEFDPLEGITWEEEIESVSADTSELDTSKQGDYAVIYTLRSTDGREQSAVRTVHVVTGGAAEWDNSDNAGNYSVVIDLGLWRLTAYMDIPEDQGPYVGQTASGAPLVPGRTVAVSDATCARLGLHFGDKLLIDGHVYTLEDHGGAPMYDRNWVDIYVDNPVDEFSERFNRYSEVYLLR